MIWAIESKLLSSSRFSCKESSLSDSLDSLFDINDVSYFAALSLKI